MQVIRANWPWAVGGGVIGVTLLVVAAALPDSILGSFVGWPILLLLLVGNIIFQPDPTPSVFIIRPNFSAGALMFSCVSFVALFAAAGAITGSVRRSFSGGTNKGRQWSLVAIGVVLILLVARLFRTI